VDTRYDVDTLQEKLNETVALTRKLKSRMTENARQLRVVTRTRPLGTDERGDGVCLRSIGNVVEVVRTGKRGSSRLQSGVSKTFGVHAALDWGCTEDEVYEEISEGVERVLEGGNSCVVMYG
jgi:hypothetical protein